MSSQYSCIPIFSSIFKGFGNYMLEYWRGRAGLPPGGERQVVRRAGAEHHLGQSEVPRHGPSPSQLAGRSQPHCVSPQSYYTESAQRSDSDWKFKLNRICFFQFFTLIISDLSNFSSERKFETKSQFNYYHEEIMYKILCTKCHLIFLIKFCPGWY